MKHTDVFKALSDPARRQILLLLKKDRMAAGEIAGHFETSHATISYHLAQLKKAQLVFSSRHRNCIYYELNPLIFVELMLWISQFTGEGVLGNIASFPKRTKGLKVVYMIKLTTERLVLREFAQKDAAELQNICNQPNVLHWMPDWKLSPTETEKLIEWYISKYPLANSTTARVMLAVTLPSGEMVGMVGIGNKEEVNNEIEVAYFLADAHTGKGYMTEAVSALVKWGLDDLHIPYIIAIVETDNYPSQAVVERCGFERIDERKILNSGDTEEKPFYYYRIRNCEDD